MTPLLSLSYTHLLYMYGRFNDSTNHRNIHDTHTRHNPHTRIATVPTCFLTLRVLLPPLHLLAQKPLQHKQEAEGDKPPPARESTLFIFIECRLKAHSLSIRDSVGALRTRVPVRASAPLFEPFVQVGNLRAGGVEELEDVGVRQHFRAVSQAQHQFCMVK